MLDGKFLVIARKDASHNEVENNAAYEEVDITHYANESKGPKS